MIILATVLILVFCNTHTHTYTHTHTHTHTLQWFSVGDDAFFSTRANLCIAAFVLSLFAVLSVIVALILTKLMPKCK